MKAGKDRQLHRPTDKIKELQQDIINVVSKTKFTYIVST